MSPPNRPSRPARARQAPWIGRLLVAVGILASSGAPPASAQSAPPAGRATNAPAAATAASIRNWGITLRDTATGGCS